MADESPAALLLDEAGNPIVPVDGTALPIDQGAALVAGEAPGGVSKRVSVDASGRPIVVGAGVAGTPAGGVASIQGVAGGIPIPISGSITATVTEADVGLVGSPAPTSASNAGGVDVAGNLETNRVHDLDTGAGTEFNLGTSIRLPASGGSVAGGTATNPLRTDPTGTTTQPISATALPLPTGAATEATLATRAAEHTTAVSPHATRLSDGAAFYKATTPTDTQPVSAVSLPLPAGAATEATLATRATEATLATRASESTLATRASETTLAAIKDTDGIKKISDPLPAGGNTIGKVDQGAPAVVGNAWPTKISDGTDIVGISTVAGAKALKVDVVQSTGSSGMGTSLADKSSFTEGTTPFTPVGGVFNETISSDPTEDQAAAARITAKRAVHTNLRNNSGTEVGTSGAPLRTDPTGTTTQPVSATSLPLPTGAATEATLATRSSEATLAAIKDTDGIKKITDALPAGSNTIGKIDQGLGGASAWKVDGSAVTQPVSAVSLPLPTGAATEATLALIKAKTDNLDVALSTRAVTGLTDAELRASAVPVSAASLPLPTGAATEATLATRATAANQTTLGSQTSKINDGTNTAAVKAASTAPVAADPALVVSISPNSAGGSFAQGAPNTAANAWPTKLVDSGGVNVASVSAAGAVKTDGSAVTQPVSGTVTANIGTTAGLALDATLTGGTQKTKIVDSGGTNVATVSAAGAVKVDGSAVTQPISAASLPLPTSAATDASVLSQSLVDNAAFIDGTTRVSPAGFIFDETAGTALTENDAAAARIDSKRAQVNVIEDATTRGQRLAVSAAGAAKVDGSAVTQPISGTVTANQGTAAAASGGWPAKITDGTDTVGISTVGSVKALKVDIVQTVGGGGTGTSQTDKSTFTEGTGTFTPVGGVFNETISADPTEDQAAAARITAKRAVHTNLRNNSGTEVGTSGAPLRTDPTGTTAQPVTDNSGSLTVDTPQLPAALVSGRLDVVTTPAVPTTAALSSASINASASGDNTLIAGTGGQTIRIFRLFLVANDSVDIKFKDGAGTDLTPAMAMTKNGGLVLDMSGEPWFITTSGNGFVLNLSAAKQVSGRIYYTKS